MTTPDRLRAALDAFLAETDPDEKARLRVAFDRLFVASMRSTERTAADFARLAANDRED